MCFDLIYEQTLVKGCCEGSFYSDVESSKGFFSIYSFPWSLDESCSGWVQKRKVFLHMKKFFIPTSDLIPEQSPGEDLCLVHKWRHSECFQADTTVQSAEVDFRFKVATRNLFPPIHGHDENPVRSPPRKTLKSTKEVINNKNLMIASIFCAPKTFFRSRSDFRRERPVRN